MFYWYMLKLDYSVSNDVSLVLALNFNMLVSLRYLIIGCKRYGRRVIRIQFDAILKRLFIKDSMCRQFPKDSSQPQYLFRGLRKKNILSFS